MTGRWFPCLLFLVALLALTPGAQAAACKPGKGATAACRGKPAAKPAARRAKASATAQAAKAAPPAAGAPLAEIAESGGCRMLMTESAARRLRELLASGTVTWDGACVDGRISGPGVLRQEGVTVENGRSKRFAYYFTGVASDGMRHGAWRRETFDRYADSPQYWTSLARVEFDHGVAIGPPKPIAVDAGNPHGTAFRTRVLEPEAARARVAVEPAPTLRASPEIQAKPSAATTPPSAAAPPPSAAALPPAVVAPAPPERPAKLVPELPAAMAAQSFGYSSACYIDTLDGRLWESEVLPVKDRRAILIQGWAIDDNAKALADSTHLRLEGAKGHRFYAPTLPVERPDVAKYLGRSELRMAGYRALVSAEGLPAGEYEVMVVMNSSGRNIICDSGRRFRLGP